MTFVWEVLTVHGNELWLFTGQGIPPTWTNFNFTPDIGAVGTISKIFIYDTVSGWFDNVSNIYLGLTSICIISKEPSTEQVNIGRTSLMKAAMNGHTEIVKILLEHEADVNATDNDGLLHNNNIIILYLHVQYTS